MENIVLELPTLSCLIIIGCLLILSAFFSSSEIALFSFRRTRLAMLVRKKNQKALLLNRVLQEPERVLSTILVGNNIVNTVGSVLATAVALTFFGEKGIFIAMLAMTFLLIQFGEIIPKAFASQSWEKVSFSVAPVLRVFSWIFYPAVEFFSLITRTFFGLLGRKIEYKKPSITRDELKQIVDLTGETGNLKKQETEMLENVFKFQDRLVKEVMLPRKNIDALDLKDPTEKQLKLITDKRHTRIPVYNGALDNIIGILHTKEYLNIVCYQNLIVLHDLLRSPYFVLENKKISEILPELQRQRIHLAVVIDKNKKVKGIVTIEDIIEEIVGEIMDEDDVVESTEPPTTKS